RALAAAAGIFAALRRGRVRSRQALGQRRQRRQRIAPALLVPVGDARVVVRQLVGVAGLDRDPDRALEADRILDVEPVHRVLAAPRPLGRAAVHRDAVIGRAVLLPRTERGVEV